MSDAALFRFISSYRNEIDYRHTGSGRRYRILASDPHRRPQPTDGLPTRADVVEEWHRYRLASRDADIAWFRRRPGINHHAVVEQLVASYPDLDTVTHDDIYAPDNDPAERTRP